MNMRVVGPTCHSHMTEKQENAVRPRAAAARSDGGRQNGARAPLQTDNDSDRRTNLEAFFFFLALIKMLLMSSDMPPNAQ